MSEDRLTGYLKALKDYGFEKEYALIKHGLFSEENGYKQAKKLIKQGVEGIVCADDFVALGALEAIKEEKLRIPEGISLVGCNNAPFTRHTHPPLTSIDIFPYELGKKTGGKLINLIGGEDVELRTLVKGELMVRESSGFRAVLSQKR